MSRMLIIRPEAEVDLEEARDWYEGQRAGLGDEFLTEVENTFDRVRQFPEAFAPGYRGVRQVRVRRFPYVVYYRITGESIEVLGVVHGSRHPRTWRSRA